jgi:hypothetical protein
VFSAIYSDEQASDDILALRSNAIKDYEPTASPQNTVRHPKKRTRRVVSEMMDNSYGDDDAVSDSKSSPKDSTPL